MPNKTNFRSNTSLYTTITQAYFDKKLELDLNQLLSLHHLVDVEVRNFKYDSEPEKNLKILKLALKRRISYLEKQSGITAKHKRKNFPMLDVQDLLEKIAA